MSKIFRLAGCVPIPDRLSDMRNFDLNTKETLNQNYPILFMAEGSLELFCDHIRPFSKGPFKYAYEANKPIIPICITTKKNKNKVSVFADGEFLCSVTAESVVKMRIKVGDQIDNQKLLDTLFESDCQTAFSKAVDNVCKSIKTQKQIEK